MLQLIAFVIFVVSLGVVFFIIFKKIPALAVLPKNGHHGFKKPKFISSIEKKLKDQHFYVFKKQVVLHKILSKVRIWVMKIERTVGDLLHGIRKKTQELDKQVKKRK